MQIKFASLSDIPVLEEIIKKAREKLKNDDVDQWQVKYPDRDLFEKEISDNTLLVILDGEKVIGMMNLSFKEDPDYLSIEHGKWLSDYEYAVIHTLAIDTDYSGQNLAANFFDFAIEKCKENKIRSLRLDTHKDNKAMKTFIKKYKFIKCGEITLSAKNEKRDAYEKIIIDFVEGDIISLKKNHPCGGNIFQIEKLGMDFRLRCINCNNNIRLDRKEVSKRLKKRLTKEEINNLKI